jgi:hypothetical protein
VIEARTPLRGGRISTGVIGTFLVAVVAALLVGGAGGYVVATASRTGVPPRETVVQQQTERQPTFLPTGIPTEKPQPTLPQQTLDPNGNVVHF